MRFTVRCIRVNIKRLNDSRGRDPPAWKKGTPWDIATSHRHMALMRMRSSANTPGGAGRVGGRGAWGEEGRRAERGVGRRGAWGAEGHGAQRGAGAEGRRAQTGTGRRGARGEEGRGALKKSVLLMHRNPAAHLPALFPRRSQRRSRLS
jgi:hypothetical protein